MINCVVIGAGPCGIVAVKELLEQHIEDVICFEQSEKLGGTFSKSYDNLTLTSSATFSMFSDFWIGDHKEHVFWSKNEAVSYWTKYATHFGVTKHIQFNTTVVDVRALQNDLTGKSGWEVRLASGTTVRCKRVVIAIGNNRIPKYPEWKHKVTAIPYSHSMQYRNAEAYKGKRVLVVGGGESASDMAYEISSVAEKCWVSLRNSTGWVVPRKRNGHAADISTHRGIWTLPVEYGKGLGQRIIKKELARKDPVFDAVAALNAKVDSKYGIRGIFGTKTLALPKAIAQYGCEVVKEIVAITEGGKRLETAEGKILEHIDAIVFSTGYKNYISFLPDEFQKCDPRSLYKHMFHSKTSANLAWMGWARPGFGSQFPIMEMQARLFSLIAAGKHILPKPSEMERIASIDRAAYLEIFQDNAYRIRSLVDYHRYMDDLAAVIGCEPPLKKYFFTNPRLWLKMVYGPTQATQFRFAGPGKKVAIAKEILKKLPLSTFNTIVKEGIKGRLQYSYTYLGYNRLKKHVLAKSFS